MKAIKVRIPAALDAAAAAEAKRLRISKSELVRRGLAVVLSGDPVAPDEDPWRYMAGFGSDGVSVVPGEIDRLVSER